MPDKRNPFKRTVEHYTFPDGTVTIRHPSEEITALIDALSPHSEVLELSKGQRLSMTHKGEKVCYLLLEGYYTYRYRRTGTIISNIYPPLIAGLGELFSTESMGIFRAEHPAIVSRVTYSSFLTRLDQQPELWPFVARILVNISNRLFLRDQQINTKNAYLTVCNLLKDLLNQPAEIRRQHTAANYILDRAALSRSTVMAIISKLHSGKHIELKRGGFLVALRDLPESLR